MRKRTAPLLILLGVLVLVAAVIFYLRSTLLLRHVGYLLEYKYGYTVHMKDVLFSSGLKAEISGLQIARPNDDRFLFASSRLDVESRFSAAIKGEVEKIVLKEPRIQVRLGEQNETEMDLSFIRKIPPVRLLTVQNGELRLLPAHTSYEIMVKEIDLNIRDFSPHKGGAVTFRGTVDVTGKGSPGVIAHGLCKGQLSLRSIFPTPAGKGIIEISLDSAAAGGATAEGGVFYLALTLDKGKATISRMDASFDRLLLSVSGKKMKIGNVALGAVMDYDLTTKAFTVEHFRWQAPSIGTLKGSCRGIMTGRFPWSADMDATGIDFAALFSLMKPFVEKPGEKGWSIKGRGSLKARLEGTMGESEPTLTGQATLTFDKGGFSSADGTKAGQGIEGTMVIRLLHPAGKKKTDATIHSEITSGEYLIGTYYKDIGKGLLEMSSDMNVTIDRDQQLDLKGSANLFNTGEYLYSGSLKRRGWNFSFSGRNISSERLVSILLRDYVQQNYPSYRNMTVTGMMNARIEGTGNGEQYGLQGSVNVDGMSVQAPDEGFEMANLSVDLPFDLHRPGSPQPKAEKSPGSIYIGRFKKGGVEFSGLTIPVTIWDNELSMPGGLAIPFYGGQIKILQCGVRNLLSPSRRFHLSADFDNVNAGALIRAITGVELPGVVEARFPNISYQDGLWSTRGITSVKAFDGVIELRNVRARNVFSPSRTVGCDIAFHDIDLGKVTDTIRIGKIQGVIAGSLDGLEIEYGQPSRFVLNLDSVKKRGVEQKISVDAIENLSIVGTGSSAVGLVLKSGINRFFKEYPYSRIGIECSLENDTFYVRGKIHEGGTEYLIRRSLLRGIDVINRDPGKAISFQDMQERIGRVFKDKGEAELTTSMK
jgi:hypothetical protein